MAGYPYSGKSFIVQKLFTFLNSGQTVVKQWKIIDPKTYRLENYDSMSEEEKRDCNLSAWEASLEDLEDVISSNSDSFLIVYDTACASFLRMNPFFAKAKECGHKVVYAFIDSPIETCCERAGKFWLPPEVINKYNDNFSVSVEKFATMADFALVIKNQGQMEPDVSKLVKILGKS